MSRFHTVIGMALTAGTLVGGAAIAYGQYDSGPAPVSPRSSSVVGQSYTFVDNNLSRDKQGLNYELPQLPPGPYAVSLFAGLEPAGETSRENLYCQVNDVTTERRILVATARWTGDTATHVSASSSARLSDRSQLRVECAAEYGPFRYFADPLRITFVRLASLKRTNLEPSSSY